MKKYECPCGYVYDPELGDPDNGIAPGTPWEEVSEDWVCRTAALTRALLPKRNQAACGSRLIQSGSRFYHEGGKYIT